MLNGIVKLCFYVELWCWFTRINKNTLTWPSRLQIIFPCFQAEIIPCDELFNSSGETKHNFRQISHSTLIRIVEIQLFPQEMWAKQDEICSPFIPTRRALHLFSKNQFGNNCFQTTWDSFGNFFFKLYSC